MSENSETAPAPINTEQSSDEFEKYRSDISDFIAKNQLKITPEGYWKEFTNAIEFVNFDTFISLVDKVIDFHKDKEIIECYYSDRRTNKFREKGKIEDSDTFMLRLLASRIKEKMLPMKIRVWNHETLKRSEHKPQEVTVIDDGVYSGTQKASQLIKLANISGLELKTVNVFVVAGTEKGMRKIRKLCEIEDINCSIEAQTELKKLKENLSKEAQDIFVYHYIKQRGSSLVAPEDLQWEDDDLRKIAEDYLDTPLSFNPFKLPDYVSIPTTLIEGIVPVGKDGKYYIDPDNLLDVDSSGVIIFPQEKKEGVFSRLFRN